MWSRLPHGNDHLALLWLKLRSPGVQAAITVLGRPRLPVSESRWRVSTFATRTRAMPTFIG
jgi:hypothetical protein